MDVRSSREASIMGKEDIQASQISDIGEVIPAASEKNL